MGCLGGGESWCQISISFANPGHLARTLSHHWTVNVALCGEKSTSVLSQVWANNLAFLQSALDSGVVPIRAASRRCRTFCGGDSPWLRRLSGVTTHWMAGSLFSYMTWCRSNAGMFLGDLFEGSNRVLKDIWSTFCDRGGGAGTLVLRCIKMLRQVNERLFLYFEVPRLNATSRSNL